MPYITSNRPCSFAENPRRLKGQTSSGGSNNRPLRLGFSESCHTFPTMRKTEKFFHSLDLETWIPSITCMEKTRPCFTNSPCYEPYLRYGLPRFAHCVFLKGPDRRCRGTAVRYSHGKAHGFRGKAVRCKMSQLGEPVDPTHIPRSLTYAR